MAYDFSLGSLAGYAPQKDNVMEKLTATGEAFAGALGAAYAQTKMPNYASVYGIDTALIVGALGAAASMFDKTDKWGSHVNNVSNGVLSVYAARLGVQLATPTPAAKNPGLLPQGAPAFGVHASEAAGAWRR